MLKSIIEKPFVAAACGGLAEPIYRQKPDAGYGSFP
jgi:hypothetical protein